MLVFMQVNDMGGAPKKLHAGEATHWHRRNYDAAGNTGHISTAARKDAEVTGVCWGKVGTGELAICRTAQQLQIWRSDYINQDLGMKPPAVADRARWPVFFDTAPKITDCDALVDGCRILPDFDELVLRTVQPAAAVPCARATAPPRVSVQASASVGQNTSVGASTLLAPVNIVAGQPSRSPQPEDADAAQSAPVSPSVVDPRLPDGAPADRGAAAMHAAPVAGGSTPQPRHNSDSQASGAALSAALLQPPPNTGPLQGPARQHLVDPISAGAGSGNHAQAHASPVSALADGAGIATPPSAATTPALHRRSDAHDYSMHNSDTEVGEGADTEGSAPPSRQEAMQAPISISARPSQHGLNNTFVEIAQSPQRLNRPARYVFHIHTICKIASCCIPVCIGLYVRNSCTKLTHLLRVATMGTVQVSWAGLITQCACFSLSAAWTQPCSAER